MIFASCLFEEYLQAEIIIPFSVVRNDLSFAQKSPRSSSSCDKSQVSFEVIFTSYQHFKSMGS